MPSSKPIKVKKVILRTLKNTISIITTLIGYKVPINALNPVGIYFRLQVLNPFAKTNMSTAMINNQPHCCRSGNGFFLNKIKKRTKHNPDINCRIAAICNAGTCCTPILLATQVVPQTIQVIANAE